MLYVSAVGLEYAKFVFDLTQLMQLMFLEGSNQIQGHVT